MHVRQQPLRYWNSCPCHPRPRAWARAGLLNLHCSKCKHQSGCYSPSHGEHGTAFASEISGWLKRRFHFGPTAEGHHSSGNFRSTRRFGAVSHACKRAVEGLSGWRIDRSRHFKTAEACRRSYEFGTGPHDTQRRCGRNPGLAYYCLAAVMSFKSPIKVSSAPGCAAIRIHAPLPSTGGSMNF